MTRDWHASPHDVMDNYVKIVILQRTKYGKKFKCTHKKLPKLPIRVSRPIKSIFRQVLNPYVLRFSDSYRLKIECLLNLQQEAKVCNHRMLIHWNLWKTIYFLEGGMHVKWKRLKILHRSWIHTYGYIIYRTGKVLKFEIFC